MKTTFNTSAKVGNEAKSNNLPQFKKETNDIYGVLVNGAHVDVSKSLHAAKIYATKNNLLTVTIRYNCGYIACEIWHKYEGYWKQVKQPK